MHTLANREKLSSFLLTQVMADVVGIEDVWDTHLVTFYLWFMAAVVSPVLAHTEYRSCGMTPASTASCVSCLPSPPLYSRFSHDRSPPREYASNLVKAIIFGTVGLFRRLHSTSSAIPKVDSDRWRDRGQ